MRVKLGFFFADLRLVELNCHVQRQVDTRWQCLTDAGFALEFRSDGSRTHLVARDADVLEVWSRDGQLMAGRLWSVCRVGLGSVPQTHAC